MLVALINSLAVTFKMRHLGGVGGGTIAQASQGTVCDTNPHTHADLCPNCSVSLSSSLLMLLGKRRVPDAVSLTWRIWMKLWTPGFSLTQAWPL